MSFDADASMLIAGCTVIQVVQVAAYVEPRSVECGWFIHHDIYCTSYIICSYMFMHIYIIIGNELMN